MILSCDAHPLSQKGYFADFPAVVTPIHVRNGAMVKARQLWFLAFQVSGEAFS